MLRKVLLAGASAALVLGTVAIAQTANNNAADNNATSANNAGANANNAAANANNAAANTNNANANNNATGGAATSGERG